MNRELTELTKKKLVIVNIAKEIGISKTADLFDLSRPTIHNWINRYEKGGLESLQNRSRANQKYPNKVPDKVAKKIIDLKLANPAISAKEIQKKLKLKYSIKTIYKKINLFLDNGQNKKHLKNLGHPFFTDFFVSIRKIQYPFQQNNNKLPKYIILVEERATGITFCSFSQERTSISIAIFLEYFIEFLNDANFTDKYKFYLSASIKLSSNDSIIKIIEDKYGYDLVKKAYISDFYPSSQKEKPYKYIYNNLFSHFSIRNNEASLLSKTFAHLLQYNLKRLKKIEECNSQIPENLYNNIKKIIYENTPIVADKHILHMDKINNNKSYFLNLYSDISSNGFYDRIKQCNSIISFLAEIGADAESKYQNKLSKYMYLSSIDFAKYYINIIPESYSEDKVFKNIVLNLIRSLMGLSNLVKLKGEFKKESELIHEAIHLTEKYDFTDQEIKLKNTLAMTYSHSKDREKSLELITYILGNPNTNKEELIRAQVIKGNYFKDNDNITTAIEVYHKALDDIGVHYPELKILILISLGVTYVEINKFKDSYSYFEEAVNISKEKKIVKYDIMLNNNIGGYYVMTREFNKAISYVLKSIQLATERGDILYKYRTLANLGSIYQMQGKYDKSLSIIKSALPYFQETKNYFYEILLLLNISVIYLKLKKYDISKKYADKVIFLSDFLKDRNRYTLGLISLMNIHIEQLDIKKIVAIQQIFINSKNETENKLTQFQVRIVGYKANFLKLLFNYPIMDFNFLQYDKSIISILEDINIDITSLQKENKAEMCFLYCRLVKYLYDFSIEENKNISTITQKIKRDYIQNINLSIKLYEELLSRISNIEYSNRLNEINNFPKI